MVLSINGFYGSGGNEIAFKVGEILGYRVLNNEPIENATKDFGLDLRKSTLEFYEEEANEELAADVNPYSKALLALQMDVLPLAQAERMSISTGNGKRGDKIEKLKRAQTDEILADAEKGNVVFVGKCSSCILEGRKGTIRFFIVAGEDSCAMRISEKYGLNIKKAKKLVEQTNRRRASAYEDFAGRRWDDPCNYDFCINSDTMGIDRIVEMITGMVR